MENKKPLNDLEDPEFTLEEARQWLHKVEDDAWLAESRAASLEFLLLNMFIALTKDRVLDGERLTQRLEAILPLVATQHRTGAVSLVKCLREILSDEAQNGYVLH